MYACKYLIFMYVHFSSLYNILLHPTKTYYTQNKIPGKCTRLIKYKKYTEKKTYWLWLESSSFPALCIYYSQSESVSLCIWRRREEKIINVVVFFSFCQYRCVFQASIPTKIYFFFISLVHRKSGKNQNKIRNFII